MIPEHCRNPNPRPWWDDNALTGAARSGYERRHERPREWGWIVEEIRAEMEGGARYAPDVVAMVRPSWVQTPLFEEAA